MLMVCVPFCHVQIKRLEEVGARSHFKLCLLPKRVIPKTHSFLFVATGCAEGLYVTQKKWMVGKIPFLRNIGVCSELIIVLLDSCFKVNGCSLSSASAYYYVLFRQGNLACQYIRRTTIDRLAR